MQILEIKSINNGSTDYVSRMLAFELGKLNNNISIIENVRQLSKNPFKWYGFYKKCHENDILHCHLGRASSFTSYFKGSSLQVSTLHGFQKIKHYKKSDFFTAVSSAVKEHFVEQGLNPDKIKVIPNGIKKDLLKLNINKSNKIIRIAQIGHLTKNIDFTFSIIEKLVKLEYNFKFIFVGDQSNIEILKNKTKALNIEKFVEFLGFVNDIENVYKSTDILFSSSKLEGFCLPVIEAMGAGIPVVTFDSKGIDDYFLHNKNGYIYNNENDALKFLMNLIDNSELRLFIGRENRSKAKMYTWDNIAFQYKNYFEELLDLSKKGLS